MAAGHHYETLMTGIDDKLRNGVFTEEYLGMRYTITISGGDRFDGHAQIEGEHDRYLPGDIGDDFDAVLGTVRAQVRSRIEKIAGRRKDE